MQPIWESDLEAREGHSPPRWHTWNQPRCDIEHARSVFNDHPLKGMPESTGTLAASRAIVFGVGATGGVATGLLAQSGIGFLDLVDPDSYGSTSFATQPASYQHRGHAKALVQGRRAQQINPACRVRAAVCQAQELLLHELRKPDVFLVAGDNSSLLIWAARMAAALGKPLVQAAVHGETSSAFLRSYDLQDPASACPACGMSDREFAEQESRFGCDMDTRLPIGREATRAMPSICQAAGAFAANEVIKWLAGRGDLAMRGEELVCSMIAHQSWRTMLPRRRNCRLPHARWQLEDVPTKAHETTLACLAGRLGIDAADPAAQVRGELPWISFTFCGSCGGKASVRRFARAGSPVGRCQCGATLPTVPQGMRSVIPPDDLKFCRDTPIASLGIESAEAIGILGGDQWVYFFTSDCAGQTQEQERRS